ncbi:DUF4362 domain-containing protein [Paractinoplanes atraurantiacus]|uniref:DUF4362 domain-containing protein n=1 Tax=Paractinoplanes atraurantiacus TaxID=1036182 RepID=UPI000BE224AA|nr:DUF4362 domain-containing protein [Actinoplanes atraurantiacus]
MKIYVLVAVLALAGCGESEAAPPEVLEKAAAVVECGTFELDQGEQLSQEAGLCLLGAAQKGQIARLEVTVPTVEGDPITTVYATRPDGSVEVVEDNRQDPWGPQEVTREVCTGPVVAEHGLTFSQCGKTTE